MRRPNSGVSPNVFSYCIAISACIKGEQWHKALKLWDELQRRGLGQEGLGPPRSAYRHVMKAVAATVDLTLDPHSDSHRRKGATNGSGRGWAKPARRQSRAQRDDQARGQEVPPHSEDGVGHLLSSVSARVADVTIRRGLSELGTRALTLVNTMRGYGMRPDARVYLQAMDVCSKAEPRQSFGVVLQLLRLLEMDFAAEIPGGYYWVVYSGYSRAITACARAGEAEKAVELLEEFYLRRRIRDVIGGGGQGGVGFYFGSEQAASPRELVDEEADPGRASTTDRDVGDRAAFDYVLGGGAGGGFGGGGGAGGGELPGGEVARATLSEQADVANVICYTAAIAACANAGKTELALRVLDLMKQRGVQPDTSTYVGCVYFPCAHVR